MGKFTRRLEITSGIAVILTSCLVVWSIFHPVIQNQRVSKPQTPAVGKVLALSHLDIKTDKTLVLALSTDCHYCSASSPFYSRLSATAHDKRVNVVSVFPQPLPVSNSYLKDKKIQVNQNLALPLSSITVSSTPTLILLGRDGRVIESWVGQLSAAKEDEVLAKL